MNFNKSLIENLSVFFRGFRGNYYFVLIKLNPY